MIDAVVFDLDGVLVDSEPVWEQVRRDVVAELGGRWTDDAQQRLMGMSTGEWARYLSHDLHASAPPDKVAALVIERMRARYKDGPPLMRGAVEAVRRLASRWPLGLASSSPPVLIDAALQGGGVKACFTVTMSTEQVPRGKPAPDIYLEVTRRMGYPPASCAAVEDSTNGIRSAVAAGLRTVAVPHPRYPPEPAALQSAALVISDLSMLTVEAVTNLDGPR
ncbi:MAG: HAD family hydrolase [Streptosporangiaceae bacterium]